MKAAALLFLCVIAGGLLGQCMPSWKSWAHEPGTEWMMDGGYRSQSGEHCCSPNRDCNPIPAHDVELTKQGWIYKPTGELVPDASVHRSRDPQDRYWRCEGTRYWGLYNQDGSTKTRCLFVGGTS